MTFSHDNRLIDLDLLHLSVINPRQTAAAEDIADLAESIDRLGLISPLVVLPAQGGRFEVCAGGQRFRALRLLADAGGWSGPVPCMVVDNPALAADIAMAENTARRELSPIDQIAGYHAAAQRGASPRDIALAFGVREQTVRQRLKLANLGPAALDALSTRQISLDQAEALSLCTDPVLAVTLLERAASGGSARDLRRMAVGERPRVTDSRVRIVGLDAYTAAGGGLIEDLFGDDTHIEDPALLDDLFAEAARAKSDALRAEGWLWADYVDAREFYNAGRGMQPIWPAGEPADGADAPFTAQQRAVAGVFFTDGFGESKNSDWRVRTYQAFVRPQDADSARAFGVLSPRDKPAPDPQPKNSDSAGLSAALLADLRAIELHAAQMALTRHPEFAADLLAFSLSNLSPRFANSLAITTAATKNTPSITDGFAPDEKIIRQDQHAPPGTDIAAAWRAFRALSPPDRFQMIAEVTAARLTHGEDHNALWQIILLSIRPDPRDIWTPNEENCFGRMRAAQLDKAHSDLIDDEAARAAFCARKRAEKVKFLHLLFNSTKAQRQGVQGWTAETEARLATWWPMEGGRG